MPYDQSLDENLFSKSCETDNARLTINVFSYNKGTKKIQISREIKDNEDNFKFAKLGRLSKEESEAIIPLMQEALTHMD